jgi:hypothetical protein
MQAAHPQLTLRPQPSPGLQRPTLRHPALGMLEYVNRDGGWWQGTATIAGLPVPMHVQQNANPSEEALQAAADFLQWVQQNEPPCRAYLAERLSAGEFQSNVPWHGRRPPTVDGPAIVKALRPAQLVLSPELAELRYDCAALPGGSLEGAHRIEVMIGAGKAPEAVLLQELDRHSRAADLLERPLPADAADFANSLADQFVATAAEGPLRFDAELKGLLDQAVEDTEGRLRKASPYATAYLTAVKAVLKDLAQLAHTQIDRLFLSVRVRHPAGKRIPLKKKLVFAPTDRARFEGAGAFPWVDLGCVDFADEGATPEALAAALHAHLEGAADWLARQSPAVFQELRAAGFLTEVFVYVVARIAEGSVDLNLPPKFLAECGRHGLTMAVALSDSTEW